MMPARFAGLALAVAVALQWAVPASLAIRSEYALRSGARYYLRTAPVDPVDAFRGRYVALRFADVEVTMPPGASWPVGTPVNVPVQTGTDHFARFGTPALQAPARGDFLRAKIRALGDDQRATLALPFDRYYLSEQAAPAAEAAYRAANRAGAPQTAYVSIRVHDGDAVLEQLFIDDLPVQRYLETRMAR